MKWTNKGHEFDNIGKIFEKNKDLVFLGNKDKAQIMKKELEFLGAKIDIIEDNDISNIDFSGKTFLIFGLYPEIEQVLKSKNLRKDINYFILQDFGIGRYFDCGDSWTTKYLSIFSVYAYNKVYISNNNMVITTICNLNCTACLNYNPYIKSKKHIDLESLKDDLDLYFRNVDKVGFFHITGGEPTLFNSLIELLDYIKVNYRHKIINLVMPTNGIKEISNELCEALKDADVILQVDNYAVTLDHYGDNYKNNIKKINENNVNAHVIPAGEIWSWAETYPPRYDYSKLTDEELTKRFDYCGCVFSQLKNKGIHVCTYQSFAENAGIVDYDPDSFFDLSGSVNKKELIEFRLKYNNKGYVNFCKKCNGLAPLNLESIKPAEQSKGVIEWDGVFTSNDYIPVDMIKMYHKVKVDTKEIIDKKIDELENNYNKLLDLIFTIIPIKKFRNLIKEKFKLK